MCWFKHELSIVYWYFFLRQVSSCIIMLYIVLLLQNISKVLLNMCKGLLMLSLNSITFDCKSLSDTLHAMWDILFVLSATCSFELRLVSAVILEYTNNNTSRIWLGLVIVSNDRRTIYIYQCWLYYMCCQLLCQSATLLRLMDTPSKQL